MENNLADKISELLADPEGMARIEAMAQSLLSGEKEEQKEEQLPNPAQLVPILSALKGGGTDERSRLLLALRPHLGEERRERVDKAIKLLRIVSVMPLLKESGILNDIL